MSWDQLSNLFWIWMAASFGLVALWCLWCYWRNLFRRAERKAVDFIAGDKPSKPAPVIPHKLKDPVTGRFVSRQELLHAALLRDVGAK